MHDSIGRGTRLDHMSILFIIITMLFVTISFEGDPLFEAFKSIESVPGGNPKISIDKKLVLFQVESFGK